MSENEAGVVIKVQVQTRASRDEVVGPYGDSLKVRITAAPVAGAANKHLLKFLAKQLKIPQSQLSLISGATSKTKSISIQGISGTEVRERFQVK
ncbi:MAG: YggU family protein [Deltaproteobacteria bacterium]|nr:MAG: YggU family protein [Deltaproteobacteria bacterium]